MGDGESEGTAMIEAALAQGPMAANGVTRGAAVPSNGGHAANTANAANGANGANGYAPALGSPDPPASSLPLAALLESLLFVADRPVTLADLARVVEADRSAVERSLGELAAACAGRGVRLQRTNGQVQMVSAPESAPAIQRFLGLEASSRLSGAALEVLSIVAYRQPATRPEIDELRGVSSDAALRTLTMRGLVEPVGRRETVGLPVEFGTTFLFLEYFGLSGLDDLPPVEAFAALEAEAAAEAAPADGPAVPDDGPAEGDA